MAFKHRATHLDKPTAGDASDGGVTVAAVTAELVAVGRESSYLGASAIKLAQRIDEATAVMGFAALVKQLEATMTSAMAGTQTKSSVIDQLKAKRDAKRAG